MNHNFFKTSANDESQVLFGDYTPHFSLVSHVSGRHLRDFPVFPKGGVKKPLRRLMTSAEVFLFLEAL